MNDFLKKLADLMEEHEVYLYSETCEDGSEEFGVHTTNDNIEKSVKLAVGGGDLVDCEELRSIEKTLK